MPLMIEFVDRVWVPIESSILFQGYSSMKTYCISARARSSPCSFDHLKNVA
jgi:hypothetical protein